jgi:hypothetical protein
MERSLTSERTLLNPPPTPAMLDTEPEFLANLGDRRDLAGAENPLTGLPIHGLQPADWFTNKVTVNRITILMESRAILNLCHFIVKTHLRLMRSLSSIAISGE